MTKKRALEIIALIYAALSVLETVAGAGAVIIVFGEVFHIWDLL